MSVPRFVAILALFFIGCDRINVSVSPATANKSSPAPSPLPENPANDSRAAALRRFPDLGKAGSPLNRRFVELYNTEKLTSTGKLARPDWPLLLAAQADKDVQAKVNGIPAKPISEKLVHPADSGPESEVRAEVRRVVNGGLLAYGNIEAPGETWEGDFILRGHPKQSGVAESDNLGTFIAKQVGTFDYGGRRLRSYQYVREGRFELEQAKPKTGTMLDQRPRSSR